MKNEVEEKINKIWMQTPATYYERGYDWNGYEVYDLVFTKRMIVGHPYVILVKGDEVRLSTAKESLEYLDYSNEMKAKSKSISELKEDIQEEI